MHAACNWAQVLEGSIDSAHSSSLHSTEMPAAEVKGSTATGTAWLRPSNDKAPRLEAEETDFGFHYAAIRKPIADPELQDYVRTTVFIAPFTVLIPPNDQYNLAQMLVPIDDVNCMFYWIAWHPTQGIAQDAWRRFCAAEVGVDLDESFRKRRNAANHYLQDREKMKAGDFTGIQGIPDPGHGDVGVDGPDRRPQPGPPRQERPRRAAVPQLMVAAARAFEKGEPPPGAAEPRPRHLELASFEGMLPKGADWRALTRRAAPSDLERLERLRREQLLGPQPAGREPLLVVVAQESVEDGSVAREAVGPPVGPELRPRLLHRRQLPRQHGGQRRSHGEILVGDRLCALEGLEQRLREPAVRLVDAAADRDDVHDREDAGALEVVLLGGHEVGEQAAHVVGPRVEGRGRARRVQRVDLAVRQHRRERLRRSDRDDLELRGQL